MSKTIVKELNALIEKRENELAVLKAATVVLISDETDDRTIRVLKETSGRRGSIKGAKRGPYKKRKSYTTIKSSFRKSVDSPNWDVEIPKVLKKSGELMTSREIIDAVHPGSYSKTKRVLHGRCSAILSLWKKQGKYVYEGEKEGWTAYGLK